MNTCLAIETGTDHASLALAHEGRFWLREMRGAEAPSRLVYRWARELLDESALEPADLDFVACGAGPGSFTGVRVALSVAQALAYTQDVPVVPVSTLAALALPVLDDAPGTYVLCALDARLGALYVGAYRSDEVILTRGFMDDALRMPAEIRLPAPGSWRLVGPGWAAQPAASRHLAVDPPSVDDIERRPMAIAVARLGLAAFAAGAGVSATAVEPRYLRNDVAKTSVARLAGDRT
jgi:tRNA threonylcarbamoyladenosine biosynthesis protein TsaB